MHRQATPLYLTSGLKLSFAHRPRSPAKPHSTNTSPIPPSPFPTARAPASPWATPGRLTWPQWLVDDQREASGRTDVLAYTSAPLTASVKISGQPIANLLASTSGTDSDWVVKLIDVYPDEVASQPEMGGYQLMISADIFRGRYRESFESPKAHRRRQAAALSHSSCPPRTTSFCPATASWCRSNPVGSRSTTATRRPSSPTSSGPSPPTTAKPLSASTMRRINRHSSSSPS